MVCGVLLVVNNVPVCGWFGFSGIGFLIIWLMGIGLKYAIEGLKLMQCDLLSFYLIIFFFALIEFSYLQFYPQILERQVILIDAISWAWLGDP